MKRIILASSSRYRQQQLKQLALPFQCYRPDLDESPMPEEPPKALAERLSRAKALAIAHAHPGALVIGADQVGELDGQLLLKPCSDINAIEQLRRCSERTVYFHSGVCLTSSSRTRFHLDTTAVRFRRLSDQQIQHYIKKEEPLDCAGSFKCEGLGIALFESIESSDPSALVGLPLIALCSMFLSEGVDPLCWQD